MGYIYTLPHTTSRFRGPVYNPAPTKRVLKRPQAVKVRRGK